MKAAKWRDLSEEELTQKARDLSEEIFNLRFQLSMGVAKNPSRIGQARRDLARAYTIARERGGTPASGGGGGGADTGPSRGAEGGGQEAAREEWRPRPRSRPRRRSRSRRRKRRIGPWGERKTREGVVVSDAMQKDAGWCGSSGVYRHPRYQRSSGCQEAEGARRGERQPRRRRVLIEEDAGRCRRKSAGVSARC
jgi:large subunit ribosomal protein L29